MPRVISKEHQLLLSNIIKTVFDPSFERGKVKCFVFSPQF